MTFCYEVVNGFGGKLPFKVTFPYMVAPHVPVFVYMTYIAYKVYVGICVLSRGYENI